MSTRAAGWSRSRCGWSKMLSPKILLDCELFRQCRRVRAGLTVDDDHLMPDVVADRIDEVIAAARRAPSRAGLARGLPQSPITRASACSRSTYSLRALASRSRSSSGVATGTILNAGLSKRRSSRESPFLYGRSLNSLPSR